MQPPPFPFEINNLLDIVGCLILQYFTIEFCVIKINSFKTADQKPSHPIKWRFFLAEHVQHLEGSLKNRDKITLQYTGPSST